MSKKLQMLITTIVGLIITGINAVLGYFQPTYAPLIIAILGLCNEAVNLITDFFIKED